jgi:uncharacterized protein (TIGR02996 family)
MATASNPGIEALIDAAPDDERLYLVYADWLQLQGDPRGELIALQCAASRTEIPSTGLTQAMQKAVRLCELEIVATTDGLVAPRDLLGWRFGFVYHLLLRLPDGLTPVVRAALEALRGTGNARFVQRLSLHSTATDFTEILEHLALLGWPGALREIDLNGSSVDLSAVGLAFPRLLRIRVLTQGAVFRAVFPSLRQLELAVNSTTWHVTPEQPLFPELRRLSIRPLRKSAVEFCRNLPRLSAQLPKLEAVSVDTRQQEALGRAWQEDMRRVYGAKAQLVQPGSPADDAP